MFRISFNRLGPTEIRLFIIACTSCFVVLHVFDMNLLSMCAFLAIIIGVGLGTFAMAFHANQGPRMGLPQMIQSRAQFGSRGALVPFVAVIFVYIGFNVFNTILATSGFKTVFAGPNWLWYLGLMVAAIVIAVVGFDLMMVVQRWLTYLLIVVFGVLTVEGSLAARQHIGGTAPGQVRAAIARARARLA